MEEILNFEYFFVIENSTKLQKNKNWKEKINWVTSSHLGPNETSLH
jgi:hypothetical protein